MEIAYTPETSVTLPTANGAKTHFSPEDRDRMHIWNFRNAIHSHTVIELT
jgi:hypothetical protein